LEVACFVIKCTKYVKLQFTVLIKLLLWLYQFSVYADLGLM